MVGKPLYILKNVVDLQFDELGLLKPLVGNTLIFTFLKFIQFSVLLIDKTDKRLNFPEIVHLFLF
jgi:hypothetical protein